MLRGNSWIDCKSYLFQQVVIYVSTDRVSFEIKINIHVFAKSTGVIISICFSISKRL